MSVAPAAITILSLVACDPAQVREAETLAYLVGQCLASGCEVYSGYVGDIGPKRYEAGVRINQAAGFRSFALLGVRYMHAPDESQPATVDLQHVTRPHFTKSAIGPWNAWAGVEPRLGQRLTIVEATVSKSVGEQRLPRATRFATESQEASDAIAFYVSLHEQYGDNPSAVPLRSRAAQISEGAHESFVVGWLSNQALRRPEVALTMISLLETSLPQQWKAKLLREVAWAHGRADPDLKRDILRSLLRASGMGVFEREER